MKKLINMVYQFFSDIYNMLIIKKIIIAIILIFPGLLSFAQYDKYDNSEKLSILAGFTSTGSEFVFWSDNVYGGNLQLVYDIIKIEEGAIGLKGSVALSDGYSGYYGGLNFRIGSRFFGDVDLLLGYSSITNEKLLSSYNSTEYNGGAFVGSMGIGYRFANPLFVRIAYTGHFPFSSKGINSVFIFQLGYRIK